MKFSLTLFLLAMILNSFSQTETDTALVADYSISKVSFINLNMTLKYPKQFHGIIKKASELNKPISVTYNSKNNTLVSCKPVSLKIDKKTTNEIVFLLTRRSMVSEVQTGNIDTIGPGLKQNISTSDLIRMFTFLVSLSCQNSTTCQNGTMPCITFQYKANGCQARAHLMRYYIEDSFGVKSKKIFLFGSLHARNSENCGGPCINWGWHVAPIVNEIDSSGAITQKVIDPSLFTRPVTIEEWKNAQINCSSNSSLDTMYIIESKFYSWNYEGRGRNKKRSFYEDNSDYGYHSYTLDFLRPRCRKCNSENGK